jgi:hypothetical protein
MREGTLALTVMLALAAPGAAHAGAWLQEAGAGLYILSYRHVDLGRAYGDDGGRLDDPFTKREIELYGETGLTDDLTLVTKARWLSARTAFDSTQGFGDGEIGLRAPLWRGEWLVASAQATAIIPGGAAAGGNPLLGSPRFGGEGRLAAGGPYKAWGRWGFWQAEVAYRHRGGAPPDEIRLDLATGITVTDRLQLTVKHHSIWAERGAGAPFRPWRQHKAALATHIRVTDWLGIEAGAAFAHAGRNAPAGHTLMLGVWLRH